MEAAACGGGGAACQTCSAGSGCLACPPGQICVAERSCGCSPESCPLGCCDFAGANGGLCQSGTFETQCGTGGRRCTDCTGPYDTLCRNCGPAFGGLTIVGGTPNDPNFPGGTCSNQQCIYPSPGTCPFGCVDGRKVCQPGSSDTACGVDGSDCTDCTASGGQCSNQQCVPADEAGVCNAKSCPGGCCDGNGVCQQGLSSRSCGKAGIDCLNCLSLGEVCSNQQCTVPDGGAKCSWVNCNGCCDSSGACIAIASDTQCGAQGSACEDCSKLGHRCIFGACVAPDGALDCSATCPGCCDSTGICKLGFIDTQCGQLGRACQDCTSQSPASTCDLSVAPRTCTSEQSTCPASYPGCAAALREQALPLRQAFCSPTDLENAAAACSGGPSAGACSDIFNGNSPCGVCLQSFDYDFATQIGIHTCLLSYLDPACNHIIACLDDCVEQACDGCVLDRTASCDMQAQAGTCAGYVQSATCVTMALNGPGAICNPATYQENFGAWLKAVGAAYCGQ